MHLQSILGLTSLLITYKFVDQKLSLFVEEIWLTDPKPAVLLWGIFGG